MHLLRERKSWLGHGTLEVMKQNSRSLNLGFDPNDDLDIPSLERWLYYSDFNYWEGTIFFDSIEDLLNKVMTTDYVKSHEILENHRINNKETNKENWQSLVRYFSDGSKYLLPKSFEEGMKIWNSKIKDPDYNRQVVSPETNKTTNKWILISEELFSNATISQIDSDCQVLYVPTSRNEVTLHTLKNNLETCKFDILPLEKQESLKYRINQHTEMDNYTKGILTGSLFLLSIGANSIQVPTEKSTEMLKEQSPFSRDTNLHPKLPGKIVYRYSDFWAIVWSAASPTRAFHQYSISLWLQRLSWFIYQEPKEKQLHNIGDMKLAKLSKKQSNILGELQAYLHYWKTETDHQNFSQTFFHIVDQITFELAVQGFMRKSDALAIRDYLLDLIFVGYNMPQLSQY